MLTKLNENKEAKYYKAIEKLTTGKRAKYLDRLEVMYMAQHGGCDDNTCTMQVAFDAGYSLLAFDMFASSGAASSEFYDLYGAFPKSDLKVAIDSEIECFNKDSDCKSLECKNKCGAHIYYYQYQGKTIGCDNCGKDFEYDQNAG